MANIFISYKREEQAIAKKLANALTRKGYSVWWDPELRAGESVDAAIEKELEAALCVIVLWSKLSVKSDYIKAEAIYALEKKKLVPVQIEEVKLPFRFKDIQTGNLAGWDGSDSFAGFTKLLSDLANRPSLARVSGIPDFVLSEEKPLPGLSHFLGEKFMLPLLAPELQLTMLLLGGNLTWTEVPGASGYILQESKDRFFLISKEVYSGENNSYGLLFHTTAYFRVKAKGGLMRNDSAWSNTVKFEEPEAAQKPEEEKPTIPLPELLPGKFMLRLPAPELQLQLPNGDGDGRILGVDGTILRGRPRSYTLNWTRIEGATGYILEESTNEEFTAPIIAYEGENNSYYLHWTRTIGFGSPSLSPAIIFYRVKAKGGLIRNDSAWSNTVEFNQVEAWIRPEAAQKPEEEKRTPRKKRRR